MWLCSSCPTLNARLPAYVPTSPPLLSCGVHHTNGSDKCAACPTRADEPGYIARPVNPAHEGRNSAASVRRDAARPDNNETTPRMPAAAQRPPQDASAQRSEPERPDSGTSQEPDRHRASTSLRARPQISA